MRHTRTWITTALAVSAIACGSDVDSADAGTDGATGGDTTAATSSPDDGGSAPVTSAGDDGDGSGPATTDPTTGPTTDPTTGPTTGDDQGDTTTGTPSGGCGADPSGLAATLDVAGETRTFIVSLPAGYDPNVPYPLVFAWHGAGGDGALAKLYFGIEEAAGGDAIFVYPDGLDVNGASGWDLMPAGRDVAFFDALLAHLTENACVDESRVFSTGHSFGGYMSNTLGCYRGDVLEAIAPVAGGGPFFGACTGEVGVWLAHGEADDVVEFQTGVDSRDLWLGENGCAGTTMPYEPAPCEAYDGCADPVVWCAHPGAHEWPDFAASAIWGFFAAQ